jgi:hypothetical protein
MFRTTTIASLFAFALVAALGCSPEVPAVPTYAKDVQPIFAAHCVRCHGEDLSLGFDPIRRLIPTFCHLNRFGDTGDCSNAGPCSYGASATICTNQTINRIADDDSPLRMPPPPSDPLNDWEKDVVKRWASTTPPAP